MSVTESMNRWAEYFLSNHPVQTSGQVSGMSPTESDYGQAEEGAEAGVERLDLGRGRGFS